MLLPNQTLIQNVKKNPDVWLPTLLNYQVKQRNFSWLIRMPSSIIKPRKIVINSNYNIKVLVTKKRTQQILRKNITKTKSTKFYLQKLLTLGLSSIFIQKITINIFSEA